MGEIKCQSQTFIGGITENTPRSDALSVTDIDGSELLNDVDIANAFTDYFASVVVNSNNLTPTIPSYHIVSPLASISLSEGDVLAAINKLKSNLSAGPDGLPPLLFKRVNQLYAFQRYCRFYSPGRHFFPFRTSPIVSLKFPHVPLPWE